MPNRPSPALTWLRRLMGLGFVVNMLFALPALFTPRLLEGLLAIGTTNTLHWLQNVGILLVIISTMYIPVIKDPFRYLFVTYLAVAGRFAAGTLFLIGVLYADFPEGMLTLSANDLILSTLQAVALFYTLRAGDPQAARPAPNERPIQEKARTSP